MSGARSVMPSLKPSLRRLGMLAALGWLAGCQAVPPLRTEPAPRPAPPPPPAPAPAPQAPAVPWDVAPVEPGDWSYRAEGRDSLALFAQAGAPPRVAFVCRAGTREVAMRLLSLDGSARQVVIRTSYGALQWPALAATDGTRLVTITRPARDQGFDWIAYSRGRIGIEAAGESLLVIPVGAEIARVVEDCRN
ncbi:hypothetical protein [Sphingobium lignivorans]|uniref:Lipoprotein n=1 Tax=Sphingobium lignivorans TaxID=2735886 RepID=A0ABR6NBG2_9SPHN|nr:hypothetical protein [Sphingobium lignivorans]MBB5984615.1 hypothetical protein [Sphingobium lignivorans]